MRSFPSVRALARVFSPGRGKSRQNPGPDGEILHADVQFLRKFQGPERQRLRGGGRATSPAAGRRISLSFEKKATVPASLRAQAALRPELKPHPDGLPIVYEEEFSIGKSQFVLIFPIRLLSHRPCQAAYRTQPLFQKLICEFSALFCSFRPFAGGTGGRGGVGLCRLAHCRKCSENSCFRTENTPTAAESKKLPLLMLYQQR